MMDDEFDYDDDDDDEKYGDDDDDDDYINNDGCNLYNDNDYADEYHNDQALTQDCGGPCHGIFWGLWTFKNWNIVALLFVAKVFI